MQQDRVIQKKKEKYTDISKSENVKNSQKIPQSFYKEGTVEPRDKVYVYLGSTEGILQTESSKIAIHYFRAKRMNSTGLTGSAYQINIFDEDGKPLDDESIVNNFVVFRDFTAANKKFSYFLCDISKYLKPQTIHLLRFSLRRVFNCEFPETIKDMLYLVSKGKTC